MRPELIDRRERRAFAPAKRQHGNVLLPEAERQRMRDRALGRFDHFFGMTVFVSGDAHVGAVERTARFEPHVRPDNLADKVEQVARTAIVGGFAKNRPAGQRHRFEQVEVLHRIFEPPPRAIGVEQAFQRFDPRRLKILTFIDDQHIGLPVLGHWHGGEALFERRKETLG